MYGRAEIRIKISRFLTSALDGSKSRRRRLLLHRVDVFSVPEVSKVYPASIFRQLIPPKCWQHCLHPQGTKTEEQKQWIASKSWNQWSRGNWELIIVALGFLSFPLIICSFTCHIQLFCRLYSVGCWDYRPMRNWEISGRKWPSPDRDIILAFVRRDWGSSWQWVSRPRFEPITTRI